MEQSSQKIFYMLERRQFMFKNINIFIIILAKYLIPNDFRQTIVILFAFSELKAFCEAE